MAKKADEKPVEDVEKVDAVEPAEELEHIIDVEGDLVDNPSIAEEPEDVEAEDETKEAEEEQPEEEEPTPSEDEEQVPDQEPDTESEPDESNVYSPTATDPGEFQPKGDYAFEITTTDGKTVKISTPEDADSFAQRLDENPDLVSASQYTRLNRLAARMDAGIEAEKQQWTADKEKFDTENAQTEARNAQITQWNNEVNYMRSKGMLPAITPELNSANWTDPEVAKNPAIKETLDVFNWMNKENEARRAAGVPEVMNAIDAYQMMKAEQAQNQVQDERKKEGDERRAKGRQVTGASQFVESSTPRNSIVGTGGSLSDLMVEEMNALNQ